jgi:hypothetical protein
VFLARANRSGDEVAGKVYLHEDETKRHARVSLEDGDNVHRLSAEATHAAWSEHQGVIEEILSSFALERLDDYSQHEDAPFRYSLRVPKSWSKTRALASDDRGVVVFTSPPIAADEDGTVHASLTVNVEARGAGGLDAHYERGVQRLGEAFRIVSHAGWKDGYVDEMTSETQVAASKIKRYYVVGDGYSYTLTFEAREDAYARVSPWFDFIASSFSQS